jgi:hypothetical protein
MDTSFTRILGSSARSVLSKTSVLSGIKRRCARRNVCARNGLPLISKAFRCAARHREASMSVLLSTERAEEPYPGLSLPSVYHLQGSWGSQRASQVSSLYGLSGSSSPRDAFAADAFLLLSHAAWRRPSTKACSRGAFDRCRSKQKRYRMVLC